MVSFHMKEIWVSIRAFVHDSQDISMYEYS